MIDFRKGAATLCISLASHTASITAAKTHLQPCGPHDGVHAVFLGLTCPAFVLGLVSPLYILPMLNPFPTRTRSPLPRMHMSTQRSPHLSPLPSRYFEDRRATMQQVVHFIYGRPMNEAEEQASI